MSVSFFGNRQVSVQNAYFCSQRVVEAGDCPADVIFQIAGPARRKLLNNPAVAVVVAKYGTEIKFKLSVGTQEAFQPLCLSFFGDFSVRFRIFDFNLYHFRILVSVGFKPAENRLRILVKRRIFTADGGRKVKPDIYGGVYLGDNLSAGFRKRVAGVAGKIGLFSAEQQTAADVDKDKRQKEKYGKNCQNIIFFQSDAACNICHNLFLTSF